MSDARAELELASAVVAICKIDAEEGYPGDKLPFERVWDEIKCQPLGVVFSQAKMLVDADKSMDDGRKALVYFSLGKFFGGILQYGKKKGVALKIRNGT